MPGRCLTLFAAAAFLAPAVRRSWQRSATTRSSAGTSARPRLSPQPAGPMRGQSVTPEIRRRYNWSYYPYWRPYQYRYWQFYYPYGGPLI